MPLTNFIYKALLNLLHLMGPTKIEVMLGICHPGMRAPALPSRQSIIWTKPSFHASWQLFNFSKQKVNHDPKPTSVRCLSSNTDIQRNASSLVSSHSLPSPLPTWHISPQHTPKGKRLTNAGRCKKRTNDVLHNNHWVTTDIFADNDG